MTDSIPIQRIESFVLRLASDGTPHPGPPKYHSADNRGTLYPDCIETVFVRVEAESGIVGWGEGLSPVGSTVTAAIIDELLSGVVVGQDAARLRPLHTRMQETMRERAQLGGYYGDAIAAVDIALWDLVGRSTGVPVAQLLGGAYRTTIPSYVSSIAGSTDEERAKTLDALFQAGARRFKLHLGRGVAADLASFDSARNAVPDADLAVDVHGVYDVPTSIRLGRGLEERGCWFLESTVPPDHLAGFVELAATLDLPIAAGETFRNRFEVAEWLSRGALDFYQPDIGRTGITEGAAITTLVNAAYKPVLPHHSLALGPALAAGLHVAAAAEVMQAFEYQINSVIMANKLLAVPIEAQPDHFVLPEGPGLGIEVLEDRVRSIAA